MHMYKPIKIGTFHKCTEPILDKLKVHHLLFGIEMWQCSYYYQRLKSFNSEYFWVCLSLSDICTAIVLCLDEGGIAGWCSMVSATILKLLSTGRHWPTFQGHMGHTEAFWNKDTFYMVFEKNVKLHILFLTCLYYNTGNKKEYPLNILDPLLKCRLVVPTWN